MDKTRSDVLLRWLGFGVVYVWFVGIIFLLLSQGHMGAMFMVANEGIGMLCVFVGLYK